VRLRSTFVLTCLAMAPVVLPAGAARAATAPEEIAELALKQTDAAARSGLALWINASDAKGLAKLAAGSQSYVQGVVADRERAERLRVELKGAEAADRVSVVWRRTAHLPYLDNLANLVVAEGWGQGELKELPIAEVMRVVHPGGWAVVGCDSLADAGALLAEAVKLKLVRAEQLERKGAWVKIAKLPDPAMGEWASGAVQGINAASIDQLVAPSKEVRWANTPLWGNSWSSYMGSSDGNYGKEIFAGARSFHTEIEWVKPGLNQYELVARDAFNGCVLWREKIPNLSNVRAADDAKVYLCEGKDLIARDAASGKVAKNYGPVAGRFVMQMRDKLITSVYVPFAVIDKESGKTVWTRPYGYSEFPPACRDGVVYMPGSTIEAVNLADGKTLWKAVPKELAVAGSAIRAITCKADTLYVLLDLTENGNKVTRLVAMDAANGNVNWSDTRPNCGAQLLPFADQVWYSYGLKPTDKDKSDMGFTVLDAKTGKEIKVIRTNGRGGCWGPRAADRYVIWSRGTFMDRKTFEIADTFGVRSSCRVGPTPAYGLLYYEPHTCNCYVALRGIFALSGGSQIPKGEVAPQLVKGPGSAVAGAPAGAADWPIYRANPGRGNSSAAELPAELKPLWTAKLGASSIPQASGAGGLVFVSVGEQHRIAALDLATGAERWSFPTEGRVTMAPTYHNGLLLIGDHAGWVYCLEASSGRLVWQLQAAPEQKYMSAYGQFESSWPVKSGVLVLADVAYFVAGRCGTMDGGIYLYGADVATGAVQMKKNFFDNQAWTRAPKTADLLLSDGRSLIGWGGGLETVKPAGKAPGGNGAAPQPTLRFGSTWQGPNAILDMLATMNPAGTYMKSIPSDGRAGGEAISFDKDRTITAWRELDGRKAKEESFGHCQVTCTQGDKKGVVAWSSMDSKLQMRALLLAGGRVYCAGIPEFRDPQEKPALVVLSAADGKELQRLPLESAPALDGLSAVGGRLILVTAEGRVLCFGAK
jgi:outer membrane protein assembly factor BamB